MSLVRRGADFATAEDAVQEALIRALVAWEDERPSDPTAWLITVAWRAFLDLARSDASRRNREVRFDTAPPPGDVPSADDTLRLYFMCAHPDLTLSSAVALTLRAVGGLTTRQIAQAYLVPESTMAQRISRAKRTVGRSRLDERGDLRTVMRVLYLVFNEGYSGDVDLASEAIRLTRQLSASVDDPEVDGLLALMLLHHARRRSRTTPEGAIVPLAEQDRSLWDRTLIAEGVVIVQPRSPATVSASTRPKRRSPHCTPTRPASRRPTGGRSPNGTTSCCVSPTRRSCGSIGRWPSVRRTGPRPGWRRWPTSTCTFRAGTRSRPTSTRGTVSWNSPPVSTPQQPATHRSSPNGITRCVKRHASTIGCASGTEAPAVRTRPSATSCLATDPPARWPLPSTGMISRREVLVGGLSAAAIVAAGAARLARRGADTPEPTVVTTPTAATPTQRSPVTVIEDPAIAESTAHRVDSPLRIDWIGGSDVAWEAVSLPDSLPASDAERRRTAARHAYPHPPGRDGRRRGELVDEAVAAGSEAIIMSINPVWLHWDEATCNEITVQHERYACLLTPISAAVSDHRARQLRDLIDRTVATGVPVYLYTQPHSAEVLANPDLMGRIATAEATIAGVRPAAAPRAPRRPDLHPGPAAPARRRRLHRHGAPHRHRRGDAGRLDRR